MLSWQHTTPQRAVAFIVGQLRMLRVKSMRKKKKKKVEKYKNLSGSALKSVVQYSIYPEISGLLQNGRRF